MTLTYITNTSAFNAANAGNTLTLPNAANWSPTQGDAGIITTCLSGTGVGSATCSVSDTHGNTYTQLGTTQYNSTTEAVATFGVVISSIAASFQLHITWVGGSATTTAGAI